MKHPLLRLVWACAAAHAILLHPAPAQAPAESQEAAVPPDWVEQFSWRSIGPSTMGGRIVDLAVYEKDPKRWWAATASGGLLKTVNNGVTFEHQFDRESTVSIGAVEVAPSNPEILWVGTGEENPRNSVSYGDGVYKSTDGGKTWTNMGLRKSFQIGAIVIHPADPDIVYVGVLGRLYGPSEDRGLYKTNDGGKSWRKIHYVDDKTGVIDIQMHPADPQTLVFATYERRRDGFDGNAPAVKIAPGSGIYRTKDGGRTFRKLTKGLPTNNLGRVGLDYFRKDPKTLFAIVECEKMGKPGEDVGWSGLVVSDVKGKVQVQSVEDESPAAAAKIGKEAVILAVDGEKVTSAEKFIQGLCQRRVGAEVELSVQVGDEVEQTKIKLGARPTRSSRQTRGRRRTRSRTRTYGGPVTFGGRLGGQGANLQGYQGADGYQHGGLFRSDDGGDSWRRINSIDPRPMYFSQFRVDPNDTKYQYVLGISGSRSVDGGETFTSDMTRGVHADQHALWVDPKDGNHLILGCDGGIYVSYDRASSWMHLNHVAIGQFYHVAVGPRRDYWVYGGLQDNGTWGAPHRGGNGGGTVNEDWIRIGGGDGFLVAIDPNDPDQVYYESQNGATQRSNLRTGERGSIRPGSNRRAAPRGAAAGAPRGANRGGRQPGTQPGTQPGAARGAASQRRRSYRYNWRTPFLLSDHNSRIYYNVGNRVFRSLDRGSNLKPISPDITASPRGSGTAIAESPLDPDVIYAGTDDGGLWMTKKGDHDWVDLWAAAGSGDAKGIADLLSNKRMWISGLEASRFAEGRVYLSVDGHRSDDDDPYVFVSEDFGRTWTSLRNNLPRGSVRVIREDRENENLLYLGTEFGLYVSLDRGKVWIRFHNNLPTVAVHEIAQHQSCGDIVIATHGRSLWSIDAGPLRQMTPKNLAKDVALFKPSEVIDWGRGRSRGASGGASRFVGQVPSSSAEIFFHLKSAPKAVSVEIRDAAGKVLRKLPAKARSGLQSVRWDGRQSTRGMSRQEMMRRFSSRRGRAGTYTVALIADDVTETTTFKISPAPK